MSQRMPPLVISDKRVKHGMDSALSNLTRDVAMGQTAEGVTYARFGLAINSRKKRGEEDVLFIEGTAFGRAAEFAGELGKGSQVFLEGRLQLNTWQTKDGQNRREIRVVADRLEVLSRKPRAEGGRESEPEPAGVPVAAGSVTDAEVPF